MDSESSGKDELVGSSTIDLLKVRTEGLEQMHLPVITPQHTHKGTVRLVVRFTPTKQKDLGKQEMSVVPSAIAGYSATSGYIQPTLLPPPPMTHAHARGRGSTPQFSRPLTHYPKTAPRHTPSLPPTLPHAYGPPQPQPQAQPMYGVPPNTPYGAAPQHPGMPPYGAPAPTLPMYGAPAAGLVSFRSLPDQFLPGVGAPQQPPGMYSHSSLPSTMSAGLPFAAAPGAPQAPHNQIPGYSQSQPDAVPAGAVAQQAMPSYTCTHLASSVQAPEGKVPAVSDQPGHPFEGASGAAAAATAAAAAAAAAAASLAAASQYSNTAPPMQPNPAAYGYYQQPPTQQPVYAAPQYPYGHPQQPQYGYGSAQPAPSHPAAPPAGLYGTSQHNPYAQAPQQVPLPAYASAPPGLPAYGGQQQGYGAPVQPSYPPSQPPSMPAYGAYGYPQPQAPQPGMPAYGYPQPAYGQLNPGSPMHSQPVPGATTYGQPTAGAAVYSQQQPVLGAPVYGQPAAGAPMYSQQPAPGAPGYSQPSQGQPAYGFASAGKGAETAHAYHMHVQGHPVPAPYPSDVNPGQAQSGSAVSPLQDSTHVQGCSAISAAPAGVASTVVLGVTAVKSGNPFQEEPSQPAAAAAAPSSVPVPLAEAQQQQQHSLLRADKIASRRLVACDPQTEVQTLDQSLGSLSLLQ
ncbi:MAG: hypothetical protein WDW38_003338 [Sanguina aurantia]